MNPVTQEINVGTSTFGSSLLQHFRVLLVLVAVGLTGCNLFDDDDPVPPAQEPGDPIPSGLQTVMSGGVEREFFIQFPPASGTASVGTGMSQVSAVGAGMSQVADHFNNAVRPTYWPRTGLSSPPVP